MYAEIGYEPGGAMTLYIYRSEAEAAEVEPRKNNHNMLLSMPLSNQDITELTVMQRIKPVNYNP